MSSIVFFFFKQKTAYDMRISDWSSDVCSSDLRRDAARAPSRPVRRDGDGQYVRRHPVRSREHVRRLDRDAALGGAPRMGRRVRPVRADPRQRARYRRAGQRSEEHTSELQSLMRISYAVFCLKKKKKLKHTSHLT